MDKYLERCEQVGWDFVPFLFDPWGGMGPAASKFMTDYILRAIGPDTPEQRRGTEARIWQRLSAAVFHQIGKQLTLFDHMVGPVGASALEQAQDPPAAGGQT